MYQYLLEDLLKHHLWVPHPEFFIQLDMRWDQKIYIFNKFPRVADATGLETMDLH